MLRIFVAVIGGWGIWVSGRGEWGDRQSKKLPDSEWRVSSDSARNRLISGLFSSIMNGFAQTRS
jgi:hypothetical protein